MQQNQQNSQKSSQVSKDQLYNFKDQGMNYDTKRPKYPQEFIEQVINLNPQSQRQNYLDVATGTGQLLFQIAPFFNGRAFGNDLSEKLVEIAQKNAQEFNKKSQIKVEILPGDFNNIPKQLEDLGFKEKFDLITVGEALHWLDVDKFFDLCKNHLLKDTGKLVVLAYLPLGFEYNTQDEQFNKQGLKHYQKFDNTILPCIAFDYQELRQAYKGYPKKYCFEKYFQHIKFVDKNDGVTGSLEYYVQYCRTHSAYCTYKKQNGDNPGYIDPVDKMEKNARKELNDYYEQKKCEKLENELIFKNYYFYYVLEN